MGASKKGKETLLIYIGWTMAYEFCRKIRIKIKKRYPKFVRASLYEGNRYDKIEIQL